MKAERRLALGWVLMVTLRQQPLLVCIHHLPSSLPTQGDDSYEDDPGTHEKMLTYSLQQELYDVSPDLLAPTVTELEMLKKEHEDLVKQREEVRERMERERSRKEEVER